MAGIQPEGPLSAERMNRVLTDLFTHRYVGVLAAEDAESFKEFYFAGSGVKVTSAGPRKSLPIGRFWVSAGETTDDAVNAALARQAEKGGLLGEILAASGGLSEEARDAGLLDQFIEELCDLFFWPGPRYRYQPGHQTRVGIVPAAGVETKKSLSVKTNLAQAVGTAKIRWHQLKEAGRRIEGVEKKFAVTAKAREILFTRDEFMSMPPLSRLLLPMFAKPRCAGEIIESGLCPWSRVLQSSAAFLESGLISGA